MDISNTTETAQRSLSEAPPSFASLAAGAPCFSLSGVCLLAAMFLAILFIAGIAATSVATGAYYLLFPELGALAQDVLTRPRGIWSNAPVLLVVTPSAAAVWGLLVARHSSYGYLSVVVAVGGTVALVELLHSPIVPAISAALLPVVFAEKSWWYPPAVLLGTTTLALVSAAWNCSPMVSRSSTAFPQGNIPRLSELSRRAYAYVGLAVFLILAVKCVSLTGFRFLLFPPLAVLGFEMFRHPRTCAWARRPLLMPLACFLTSGGGLLFAKLWGLGPLAAACGMAWGFLVLHILRVHIPPAMAVTLIPLIMTRPGVTYPIAVALGTLLLTFCFLIYRQLIGNQT